MSDKNRTNIDNELASVNTERALSSMLGAITGSIIGNKMKNVIIELIDESILN